jgi:hypothetical protein
MTYELKRYKALGNGFVEDSNRAIPGVEFTDGSETFREIAVNFSNFDLANRTCTAVFRREAQTLGGSWAYVSSYTKTVSDTSGGINLSNGSFAPYDQCLEDDGITWKQGIVSEAEFTINTIVFNTYGISVSISQFLYNAILRTNGLI